MARVLTQDNALRELFEEWLERKKQRARDEARASVDADMAFLYPKLAGDFAVYQCDKTQQACVDKGTQGETEVAGLLERDLADSWVLFNDVIIEPKFDMLTQIDHIAIGPPGLFVIETKAWKAPCSGYKDKWKRQQGKNWVKCDNSPTKQNAYHTELIIKWLSDTGLKRVPIPTGEWIIPVIVFTQSPWVKTTDCSMRVCDKPAELVTYFKRLRAAHLDREQVDMIANLIRYPRLNKALREKKIHWYG